MSSWSVEIVVHALSKEGLSALGPVFREHNIRGVTLGRLTDERLNSIGISSLGQIDEVLLMVEKYQKRDAEVKSAAAVSVSGRGPQGQVSVSPSGAHEDEWDAHLRKAREELSDILSFIQPRVKRDEAVNRLIEQEVYDLDSMKVLGTQHFERMGNIIPNSSRFYVGHIMQSC